MSFLTILVERKEYAIWFARPRSTKGGYRTKKNRVGEILTLEKWASEYEKITRRPDFFTWMRALDPGGLGHIVGGPRRIEDPRAQRGLTALREYEMVLLRTC
jgi:hypothetical protein